MRRRLPIPASREFDRFAGGAQFRDRIGIVVQRTRWTTARATVAEKLQPLPGDNLIARPDHSRTAEEDASVIGNSEGRRVATGEEPCLSANHTR